MFQCRIRGEQVKGSNPPKKAGAFCSNCLPSADFDRAACERPGSSSHQPFSFFSSDGPPRPVSERDSRGLVLEQTSKWMESSFFVTVGTEVSSEPQ